MVLRILEAASGPTPLPARVMHALFPFSLTRLAFLLMRMMPTDYFFTEDELIKLTEAQKQSNSEMTQAANGLKGLPADIVNGIQSLMGTIGITIDGSVLMGYVNTNQAAQIGS